MPGMLHVVRKGLVTPRMLRVTLGGDDLPGLLAEAEGPNIKLLIGRDGADPVMPGRDDMGRPRWAPGEARPHIRTFTVRRCDAAAGEIDVDFVLHPHGPAGRWAMGAEPGTQIGVGGLGGLSIQPAEWYLFCGDETCVPAISNLLPKLAPDVRAVALIEVADAEDEQTIEHGPGVDLRWLHRGSAAAGTTSLLADAVRDLAWPDEASKFAWVGGESNAVRAIRTHLRDERGLPRADMLTIGYWRAGLDEDEYHNQFNNDREHEDMFGRHAEHGHEGAP